MVTLEQLRNDLDITWEDAKTDDKLRGELARVMSYLNSRAGVELDYEEDNTFLDQLVLDGCRYMHNHAFEDFKHNFADELWNLRAGKAVEAYEEDSDV